MRLRDALEPPGILAIIMKELEAPCRYIQNSPPTLFVLCLDQGTYDHLSMLV